MTDKEEQLQQFREAVDRKAQASEEASHAHPSRAAPHEENPTGDADDDFSPRASSQQKGKVTADKWNQ